MGSVQRLQQDLGVAFCQPLSCLLYGRPARGVFVGSEQTDDKNRQLLNQFCHLQQELKGGAISPVHIVEHDHRSHQLGAGPQVAPARPPMCSTSASPSRAPTASRVASLSTERITSRYRESPSGMATEAGSRCSFSRTRWGAWPSLAPIASRITCRHGK